MDNYKQPLVNTGYWYLSANMVVSDVPVSFVYPGAFYNQEFIFRSPVGVLMNPPGFMGT
jgi:hypothetical protein